MTDALQKDILNLYVNHIGSLGYLQMFFQVFFIICNSTWCNNRLLQDFKTYFTAQVVGYFTLLQKHALINENSAI